MPAMGNPAKRPLHTACKRFSGSVGVQVREQDALDKSVALVILQLVHNRPNRSITQVTRYWQPAPSAVLFPRSEKARGSHAALNRHS